jgi:hypothetical protein
MENNENLVIEKVAENVEQTTEESPKMYTEEEFNAKVNEIAGTRAARKERKIRKEYERKYGDLMDTLRAGTGKETVEEITETYKGFYEKKGIEIPKKAEYSAKDIETLAKAEADEYIRGGFEDVVEEVDRLTDIGFDNMTAREKAVFKLLAEHRQNAEKSNELAQIGVTEDVYNSKEFQEFAADFNPSTPIKKVYDIYVKTQPKKEYKTMGSMKNGATANNSGVKEFYSYDEAVRFSQKEINSNPALYEAIKKSMLKWK